MGRRAAGRPADHGQRSRPATQEPGEQSRRAYPRAASAAPGGAPDPHSRWTGGSGVPPPFDDYRRARRLFQAAALEAQLHDGGRNPSGKPRPNVTIHDLRHTFGVHCAQAGVPIVRLQKLLGHASPHMTQRYMKHAPESYFAEDAARVAASLTGAHDPETVALAMLARNAMRKA